MSIRIEEQDDLDKKEIALMGQKEGQSEAVTKYPDFPEQVGTIPKIRKIGQAAP